MTRGRVIACLLFLAFGAACRTEMMLSDDRDATPDDRADGGSGGGGTSASGGSGGRSETGGLGGTDGGGAGTGGSTGLGGAAADTCRGATVGTCSSTLTCLTCPSGPTTAQYLCTTACSADSDCQDPVRPLCNHPNGGAGVCTTSTFVCQWQMRCASPLTLIATPGGPIPIADLKVGDLVYSVNRGEVTAVPLVRTFSAPVIGHHVVRVALASGRVLEISEGHPTANGRLFADLAPGDALGTEQVSSVESIAFRFTRTYDILPASDTGAYFAEGALIGSTLATPNAVHWSPSGLAVSGH